MTKAFRLVTSLTIGLLAATAASAVRAESDEEIATFYRSRPIIFEVGFSVGSAYDVMGRTVARFLGRHMPGNPTVIVVNQPGAGSLSTANRAYNVMQRDGSKIATFNRSIFMEPLLGNKQALFDPAKFSWIGSVADEMSVCVSWHTSKVKTWNDLFRETLVVGANAAGSDTGVFANLIKRVFDAKNTCGGGLSGRRANYACNRKRRSRWPLRLVVERDPVQQSGLDCRQIDQHSGTAWHEEPSAVEGRAGYRRPRHHRQPA